nr:hypothetical protein [Lachnospiraceae bacterium]
AYLSKKIKLKNKLSIIGVCLFIVLTYMVACNGLKFGIHTDNISGYLWHSLMALCLGGIIFFFQLLDFETNNFIMKLILFISKYEYGIYIVHLVLMLNLLQGSEIIQFVQTKSILITIFILTFLSLMSGIVYSFLVDGVRTFFGAE